MKVHKGVVMISEIQQYLINIRNLYPHLPKVELTGVYDEATESAVRAFQIMKGLPQPVLLT